MIYLDKGFVITLYCHTRQAERSVHRALQADWSDLRNYYTAQKKQSIQGILTGLTERLPFGISAAPCPSRKEVGSGAPPPGVMRLLFAPWISRWKRRWCFSSTEIQFVACTLQTLLRLLETTVRPNDGILIALRIDLCTCGGLIQNRCWGLGEIIRARRIEHFNQTDWVLHVPITELVQESLPQPNAAQTADSPNRRVGSR